MFLRNVSHSGLVAGPGLPSDGETSTTLQHVFEVAILRTGLPTYLS